MALTPLQQEQADQYRDMRQMMEIRKYAQQEKQDPAINQQEQDRQAQLATQPEGAPQPEPLDPAEVLPQLLNHFMDYTMGIKQNPQLNEQVRSQIMLQQAQALNYLYPLLTQPTKLLEAQAKIAKVQQDGEANQAKLMTEQHNQTNQQLDAMKKAQEIVHAEDKHPHEVKALERQNKQPLQANSTSKPTSKGAKK